MSELEPAGPERKPRRPAYKTRLSELAVKRLKTRAVIWDTKQQGLALRVRARRTFYYVYSRHGRPRWLKLGDAGIGLAAARELAAEAMLQVARGKDPAAEKKARRGRGTFAELAERYVHEYSKKNNKSWAQPDALIRRHVLPKWAKLQAANITRSDIKALSASIEKPSVAMQTILAVSAILSWGVNEELVGANPCKGIAQKVTKDRERILAKGEIAKIWPAFDEAGLVASSALKMILLTGQRPGEVSCMRREHIVDGWWELPGEPISGLGWPGTKNGKSHRVFLSAPARAVIDEISVGDQKTGFVFANSRGRPHGKLAPFMRQVCETLGIERATPHDLRRTFGSTVTALGFGRQAMDRVLNHSDTSVGSVYDRYGYSDQDEKLMETVGAHIMSLVEGKAAANVVQMRR